MDDIEKLKIRVEKDPNSRLFLPLAEEYRKAGMLDEAISVLLKGLERHPSYTSARVALGKIYLEKKMIEEARSEFEKVIAAIPDNLFAHKKLAEIYRDIGEIDRAIAEYKAVLDINPLDEDAKSFIEDIERPGEEKVIEEVVSEPVQESPIPETVEEVPEAEIRETPAWPAMGFEAEVSKPMDIPAEGTEPLSEEGTAWVSGEEGEFFGIPEDQIFDLSGEEPVGVQNIESLLPEDIMEVRSPSPEIEESVEQSPFEGMVFHEEDQSVRQAHDVLDFSEADAFVADGQYYKALDRYKEMLKDHPDNRKVLQRIAELKNLLKLLGKDEEIVSRLEAFLEGIRRRRDEFFGSS